MRGFQTVLMLAAICAAQFARPGFAQPRRATRFRPRQDATAAQSSPPQSGSTAPSAAPQSETVSALVQPSLDGARATVGSLQMEKWKRGPMRDEATANIVSIRRDIDIHAAGSAEKTPMQIVPRPARRCPSPATSTRSMTYCCGWSMPLALLRPAISSLRCKRRWPISRRRGTPLDDRIQTGAAAQEKQIGDLQVALKAQAKPAPACPVVPAAPAPAPASAKKPAPKKRKPVAKPATTPPTTNSQPANAQPNAPAKPNQ